MKVLPLSQQSSGPAWFIVDAGKDGFTIEDLEGNSRSYHGFSESFDGLMGLCGSPVYSMVEPMDLIWTVNPEYWSLTRQSERYINAKFTTDGYSIHKNGGNKLRTRKTRPSVTIYPLATFGKSSYDVAPFFLELQRAGVAFGSLGSMSYASWRRTLKDELFLGEQRHEGSAKAGRNAFSGGRREVLRYPASYRATAYVDMPAAYLHAMQGNMPTRLVRSPTGWYKSGIARAVVTIPEQGAAWYPLPKKELRFTEKAPWTEEALWGFGRAHSYWTMGELQNARERGASVKILESWEGVDEKPIFDSWLVWAYRLRQLSGYSGALAKQFTNKLWARFGMNNRNRRKVTTFTSDGEPMHRTLPPIPCREETAYVSSIVAARNRVRLYDLMDRGATLVDTDGGILPLDNAASLEAQGWVRKEEMEVTEVSSPKQWRWKCIRGLRNHLAIDGCVDCMGDRWHTFVDGEGYTSRATDEEVTSSRSFGVLN